MEQSGAPERGGLRAALGGMRPFLVIWAGQLVSGVGSGLTGFALPVWIYQKTGSAEQFGLLLFAATVPSLLLAPFAGALVDRWSRKTVLVLSDLGSALMTLAIAILVFTDSFQVWHLFVISVVGSAMGSFQQPAFAASIAMLVPRQHFTRASGLMQTAGSATGILVPLIAGVLVTVVGLGTVLLIDVATFLVAMVTLAISRIPDPPPSAHAPVRKSLVREAAFGWTYIQTRTGLLGLLVFFAIVNFAMTMGSVLMAPMVLSISSPATLGAIASTASIGSLLGGIMMSTWGGPKRRVLGIVGAGIVAGIGVTIAGLRPSIPLIAAGMATVMFVSPVIIASSSAIWLSKTPADLQGRVFAIRRMIAMSMTPIAMLVAPVLAERLFEPLMAPGGGFAGTLGLVLGTGQGRGVGLMLVMVGVFVTVAPIALFMVPRVRNVEEELPDAPLPVPGQPHPAPAPRPAAEPAGSPAGT